MVTNMDMVDIDTKKQPVFMRDVLIEQLRWLIRLRWFAIAGVFSAGLVCTYVFPIVKSAAAIYAVAVLLLVCNLFYLWLITRHPPRPGPVASAFGMVQVELDLIILTLLLHSSGGITNPFVLFYIFHVIIAAIILPLRLSFTVAISAICMFILLALGMLDGWSWLGHQPLNLSTTSGLWKNTAFIHAHFAAFITSILLTLYLTRTVIARMAAKEREAARNKDVLEAIIHAMAEGLIFVTNNGELAICNPEATHWTDGAGSDLKTVINDFPDALKEHVEMLLDTDRSARPFDTRIKFETDGPAKIYVEARSCPVETVDGARLGHVIVGQDMTEHKKLERKLIERTEETATINEMLKKSRIEMAQREKMVAIGQMASGIAHEIGNPLASLSSVAQYLKRKITNPEQNSQLDMIAKQVNRISGILKRMLTLARPATSEYKWSDVNTTIERMLSLVRFDRRAKDVEFRSTPETGLPMVWLNPLLFEQVLLNITVNALDAIVAKNEPDEQHVVGIEREFKDGMVEVRISDTGVGMESGVCRRAFESFFTTKEIGKGTGLGLFISNNLIREIDGTISLESEPGKGTTVTIRIPTKPKKNLITSEESSNENQDTVSG